MKGLALAKRKELLNKELDKSAKFNKCLQFLHFIFNKVFFFFLLKK